MRNTRLFILVVAIFGASTTLHAQAPLSVAAVAPTSAGAPSISAAPDTDTQAVRLMVGRSTLVDVTSPIARVSLTSPDVADALVTAPTQLLIHGKIPGTISMFVWDRLGGTRRYEVVVQRDLARLAEQVKQLFPGEEIEVQSNGRNIVLNGKVSAKDVIERATNVAAGYVDKKEEVVSLLQIRDGGASNQVLLRVRFAEVNRSAMTELGSSIFTGPGGYKDVVGRATTQQFPAPDFDNDEGLVFSDYLNLFLFDVKNQLGTVIKALQSKGLFQSLAEPNLVAESGKEASFLAGGEIPVPIAQGSGSSMAISVQYKEFGIRLSFLPVVIGNRVHLKVKPEVSTLDFANAVVLNGFRIPALTTRRTETELELENGQTFAIAGLMNNTVNSTLSKIPGIGDIPILGLLFKSKSAQKNQTELVVMITPEILRNNSSGVTPVLPRTPEQYLPALPQKDSHESPPAAFPLVAVTPAAVLPATGQPVAAAAPSTTSAPTAQSAAATLAAPYRMTKPVINGDAPPTTTAAVPAAPAAPVSAQAAPAAMAPAPPGPTPAAAVSRPLTKDEQKRLDRAHKEEERAKATAARMAGEQALLDRKQQQKDAEQKAKQDRERAKVEAEAARLAAEQERRTATLEAKRQKAQQAADAKRQKSVDEAQAKLKEAEALYQSEISKKSKTQ